MVRARASPYCLAVMALVACCLSTAPGQESKTWLESLRHCQQEGRELATPSNGGFNPPESGIFWVGALVSVTDWVWGRGDPLYRSVGCQRVVSSRGIDLGVANEAGACFHRCSGKRFVALKGTMCYCLDNGDFANDDGCTKPCYRNPNNTCGGENTYSVYRLNLLNSTTSQTIAMNWTLGHETAATFDSPSQDEWWIVPTPRSSTGIFIYCYRHDDVCRGGCIFFQKTSIAWPYEEFSCKIDYPQYKDIILNSNSSIVLIVKPQSSGRKQGWIFLSRRSFGRWMQNGKTERFPPVGETELGPLCGAVMWNKGNTAFRWENCNANHAFLCSPAVSGTPSQPTPSQPESGVLQIIYVAAGGAGGVVFLGAVIVSIFLCRKRAGRQGGGSKADRQKPIEQGHVTSYANVPEDPYPDGGHYDVMAEDGAACTVYKNVPAGSSTKQIELVEDELEGNYACVDEPPKANALPVQKEAESASSPSPAPAADEADSCMYAVVQKPTYQNAPARQEAEPEKAAPPLDTQEVKPLEELYACVKK